MHLLLFVDEDSLLALLVVNLFKRLHWHGVVFATQWIINVNELLLLVIARDQHAVGGRCDVNFALLCLPGLHVVHWPKV